MSGKLAKALDRLRHEPPLQGEGEARLGRLWTGLKPKALLDGRTPRFFSQRVVPRWRATQGANRHMVVGGHAPVTSALNLLQSSSSFFQSFVRHRPYRVPCPVPQGSLLVTLLSNQRAASDALPADENLDLAEFLTGLCF